MAQERAQAELDAPKLGDVLELKPGMTVADVGAGGGAMTVVLGKWIGSGRVLATDISARQLAMIREVRDPRGPGQRHRDRRRGGVHQPARVCDAVFLRHVYHHISDVEPFNKSLYASLKPGGRLAIIDFVPEKGSQVPAGVPTNREGHGIPPSIVIAEVSVPGLTPVKTIDRWPPGDKNPAGFLGALPEAVAARPACPFGYTPHHR